LVTSFLPLRLRRSRNPLGSGSYSFFLYQ